MVSQKNAHEIRSLKKISRKLKTPETEVSGVSILMIR